LTVLYWVVGLVALQRLLELAYARHNTVKLRRLGAVEADAAGYPFFVLMHAAWLASLALFVPATVPPYWPLLGFFALLQLGRVWVIHSLSSHWTTRLVTLPDAPLVQTGPYRYFRHPNYLLVIAEVAVLPLTFGAVAIAAIFSALNLVLIARRIRIEDGVLASRRAL
jgi:methyltransferase